MLSENEILRLSANLRIDRERIVREFYEMLVLNEIAANLWSQWLVFKGGTALRLAYQSPRFSDDLDFVLTQSIPTSDIFRLADQTANKFTLQISDKSEKKSTILIEYKISPPELPQSFHIKIEISKRIQPAIKSELKIISSPVCSLQILMPVLTMENMIEEKISAWNQRKAPRDLFDLWFLSQKTQRSFSKMIQKLTIVSEDRASLRSEMNKYLPLNWRQVIDEMDQIIQRNQ
ncbi:MAG: nucleotidyl transferase AbiEii/AbiGii toxin family protein [Candidatus Neomarinimicrobiota bacterium]